MKKNLEILDFEEKKTQAGKPYVRFKTSEGWMSCFESKAYEELKKWKGKTVSVEVFKSGEFSNIKKCYGNEDDSEVEVEKPVVSVNRNATMYVSYAKDIFCAMYEKDFNKEDLMNMSINLVKQAKEAFE